MTQLLHLALGHFGQRALEREARGQSVPTATVVRHAALYYLSQADSGRAAVRLPEFARFAPSASVERGDGQMDVDLDLERDDWLSLRRAAEHEQVSIELVVRHAVLLFLADLEAGVLATKLIAD